MFFTALTHAPRLLVRNAIERELQQMLSDGGLAKELPLGNEQVTKDIVSLRLETSSEPKAIGNVIAKKIHSELTGKPLSKA